MSTHRISISLQDLPDDLQRRLAELPVSVRRGLQSGTMYGRTMLSKRSPTDQGQLRNSWKLIDYAAGARGAGRHSMLQLVNEAPHAGIVERGARPHRVSKEGIEALAQWAWRNRSSFSLAKVQGPIKPKKLGGKGGRRALQKQTDMAIVRGIAFAIAWKIRHHGQKPTFFVRDSMPRIGSVTRKEVRLEIDRLAGRRFR